MLLSFKLILPKFCYEFCTSVAPRSLRFPFSYFICFCLYRLCFADSAVIIGICRFFFLSVSLFALQFTLWIMQLAVLYYVVSHLELICSQLHYPPSILWFLTSSLRVISYSSRLLQCVYFLISTTFQHQICGFWLAIITIRLSFYLSPLSRYLFRMSTTM